jgi:transposase InsO family protein
LVGISIRTYQRWLKSEEDKRTTTIRPTPKNKLTFQEIQELLKVINSLEYQNLPPTQIVPRLADKGIYLASESTMYRIMKQYNQNAHRGKSKQAVKRPISSHVANGPNEVWTWDITWLMSHIKGKYYKLYLIVDIYSRMIVAWEVWEEETSENASILIEKAVISQKLRGKPMVLHSDNGSPMKGATFQATME